MYSFQRILIVVVLLGLGWSAPSCAQAAWFLGAFVQDADRVKNAAFRPGIYVRGTIAGSPASKHLKRGDVITAIDKKRIRDLKEFDTALRASNGTILVTIYRKEKLTAVRIELEKD